MSQDNNITGWLGDEIHEAVLWRPIVPLLKKARDTHDLAAKLVAVREVIACFTRIVTNQKTDPYASPGFMALALLVDLAQTDKRVLDTIKRLLPPE